jgi:hypothetical protein
MTTTTFINGTIVQPEWLNDVNAASYGQVPNLTGLRALAHTTFSRAIVFGHTTPGDGGGGQYYYDSSDTTTADNGGTVIVASDGGRWKVTQPSVVTLEHFGAKADWDGATGTDNAPFLAAAIAALPAAGGTVQLGSGYYYVASTVTLPSPGHYTIVGKGNAEASNNNGSTEIIVAPGVTNSAFIISSPCTTIKDVVIRGILGNTANGITILANNVKLENVSVFKMGNDGVRVGSTTATVNANTWSTINCRFNDNVRYGLYLEDKVLPTLPDASGGTWVNCMAQGNGNDGIRIGNATLNTFLGGVVESNVGCGIRFFGNGSNYNSVYGMDFDNGNTAGKLRVETGSAYNRIDSATVFDTEVVDNGTKTQLNVPNSSNAGWYSKGIFRIQMGRDGGANDIISGATGGYLRFTYGGDPLDDAHGQIILGSAGLNLGYSGSKVGFYGTTPVVKGSLPVAAVDPATTMALANAIRALLISYGLA